MAAFILHKDAIVVCDHTPGLAQSTMPSPRVSVSGMPVVTLLSPYTITGCGLSGSSNPPCLSGMWTKGATRVLVGGFPVAIQGGTALCLPTMGNLTARSMQQRAQAE
jgi:uncharacterized Zn-binding protein involved in type VI secretion